MSAHEAFADRLTGEGKDKLLSLWAGPDSTVPEAVLRRPPKVADPHGGNEGALTLGERVALR